MALWRFGRGWSEAELAGHLAEMARQPVNFDVPPERMTRPEGWRVHGVHDAPVGTEAPGPPAEDGPFARGRQAIINYDFSDPRTVEGHFDPAAPLDGRTMLLEMKLAGVRFLCACRVRGVREEEDGNRSLFALRYDTLRGHIERGVESFIIEKNHATGAVTFTIEARWRLGEFPNLWSLVGFELVGRHVRHRWRHHSAERLRRLVGRGEVRPVADAGGLAHRGDREPGRTWMPADRPWHRPPVGRGAEAPRPDR